MEPNYTEQILAARRISAPLIGIVCADPAATIAKTTELVEEDSRKRGRDIPPIINWDIIRGWQGVNNEAKSLIKQMFGDDVAAVTGNPSESLDAATKLPEGSVLFFQNAQNFLENETVSQAVWNLRDRFKRNRRTLMLMGPMLSIPPQLAGDILVFVDPLPDATELAEVVKTTYESGGLEQPNGDMVSRAVDALLGLPAFAAEQISAMALRKDGLDMQRLWSRKKQAVEQIKGLSIYDGVEKFGDIGGCDSIKDYMKAMFAGPKRPRCIVFIDEIDKDMSGLNDNTGINQGFLRTLLVEMQDKNYTGMMFLGPPGAAKSVIAKASGNEAGIPTIVMDLGAMKNSLVGASETSLRQAMAVIETISQGRALFIATCNRISMIPPELRRRFKKGTYFFDLPTKSERDVIWNIYMRKFEIAPQDMPSDNGWTGAEIEQCCSEAFDLNWPLSKAANKVVPVSVSAAAEINRLRREASGRYLSASHEGLYLYDETVQPDASATSRLVEFAE